MRNKIDAQKLILKDLSKIEKFISKALIAINKARYGSSNYENIQKALHIAYARCTELRNLETF